MKTDRTPPRNIDEYIAGFPRAVQAVLERVRNTIRKAVPDAEETISYRIPTFKLHGRYVLYFAGVAASLLALPVNRSPDCRVQGRPRAVRGQWQGHDPVPALRAGPCEVDPGHREVSREGSRREREGEKRCSEEAPRDLT